MQKLRTHYDNLQIAEHAGDEVIRGAYRYLCQKWHPDKHPEDAERAARIMRIINQAYEVLSDPERRKTHDTWIRQRRAELQEEQERSNAYARAQAAEAAARVESEACAQREAEQSARDREVLQRSQRAQAEAASNAKKPPDVPPDVPGTTSHLDNSWSGERLSPGSHPLRRFFARTVDTAIIVWLGILIFTEIGSKYPQSILLTDLVTTAVGGMVLAMVFWVAYHGLMLSLFGSTPGKWIFGILIRKRDGTPITLTDAFGREALVNIFGFGLHIPMLSMVTMVIAGYWIEKHGWSYWDDLMKFELAHREWRVVRSLASVGATLFAWIYIVGALKQGEAARADLLSLRAQQVQSTTPPPAQAKPPLLEQPSPPPQMPADDRGAFLFSNSCDRPVQLAMHYIDVNGIYQTRGWWTFQPNERTYLHDDNSMRIYTKSADWYYYAFTLDGSNLEWRGDYPVLFENNSIPMIKMQDTEGDSEWAIRCD